jgi:transcriptional regulator with XRE-family HTH domain
MTEPSTDLALSLTLLRLSRGWNQDTLAKASGVTNSALSEYERGKKTPELKTLFKIVSALGYSLSALERSAGFLAELRAESLLEVQLVEPDGTCALVPVGSVSSPAVDVLHPRARARRVAAQLGQAVTSVSLLLFDLLMGRQSSQS